MSITTVQQAFEEYEKKVRAPKRQVDRAREVHPEVRAAVEKDLGDLFNRAFLAGSYARKVQTAPKVKDVDIIVVLNDPDGGFAASAKAALERLREAAKTCDLVELPTRLGCRAVKLNIKGEEFTVDLVAALEDGTGGIKLARHLPDENLDDWTPADPKAQMDAHWAKNKDCEGVFIPAVRIVKSWNQRNRWNGKNALPSYLAESILFLAMTVKADYPDVILAFLREADEHLARSSPSVPCPGNPSQYVDERLDDERRRAALDKVRRDLKHAEDAVAESDPGKAMDLWAKVFGPVFPAPSAATSALAAALRSGAAVAQGTGISPKSNGGRQVIPARPWRSE